MTSHNAIDSEIPIQVSLGGTGVITTTANGVICAGTTSTGAFQVVSPGTTGDILTSNGSSSPPSFQTSGYVVGPSSATDNAIARYDGTTGKIVQNSSVTIDDSGNFVITAGNGSVTRSASGSNVAFQVSNTSNTASSDAQLSAIVAGTSGGNPHMLYTVMGGSSWASGINNASNDRYTISVGGVIGTSDALRIETDGTTSIVRGDLYTTRSNSGGPVAVNLINSSNTSSSTSLFQAIVGGTSAGQAANVYSNGTQAWSAGLATDQSYRIAATSDTSTNTVFKANTDFSILIPSGNFNVTRSASGSTVASIVQNNSNTASSAAHFEAIVAGTSSGNPLTLYTVMGGNSYATGIDTSAGSYKIAVGGILGSNDALIVNSSGLVQVSLGDLNVSRNSSGGSVIAEIINSSNTANSSSIMQCLVNGSSAGDPYVQYIINGITNVVSGIDNSDGDSYKVSMSSALGTTDALKITTAGQITKPLQSTFAAYNTSQDDDVTGDGTLYTVIFNNASSNINSNYDNTTGVYTAPVDGFYDFSATVLLGGILSSHTLGYVSLLAGGNEFRGAQLNVGTAFSAGGVLSLTVSHARIFLTAGQTAQVQILVSGGTKVVDVGAGTAPNLFTYFSGGLCN